MFGLKKEVKKPKTEEVKEPVFEDIAIELKADLTGQKKEEYDLALELGMRRQAEIIKLESFGFKSIRRADCYNLLGLPLESKDITLSAFTLDGFEAKIPFGLMCRIKEIREKDIFDKLYIVAPEKRSTVDPLLVGEKFTSLDSRTLPPKQDYWDVQHNTYPSKLGYRRNNFWRRDTIVMLIAQWK